VYVHVGKGWRVVVHAVEDGLMGESEYSTDT
jgi:hypothetical protein